MNPPRIVYKVTKIDLTSAIITNDAVIQYKVGEYVEPKLKGSKILVFKTLKDARRFHKAESEFRELKLWKAVAPSVTEVEWLIFSCATWEDFIRMWINRGGTGYCNAPQGTLGCEKLKLLKEII